MSAVPDQRRLFASSGLKIPQIVLGTAAFGNVPNIIPEQRKIEICSTWFRSLATPLFIDVDYRQGNGLAIEVLGRILRRMQISSDDVVVHLTLDARQLADHWEKSVRLLGLKFRPRLISLYRADNSTLQTAHDLKTAGVLGVGITTSGLESPNASVLLSSAPDWILLNGGFTPIRHSLETRRMMAVCAARQIPLIVSGIFEGGFLTGSGSLDGRSLRSEEPADRSLLAWRTSFAALCHGHGVTPAQACVEFALSGASVVAVLLNSSHPDRVAENIACINRKAPAAFWDSLKEEGLLASAVFDWVF